VFVTSDSPNSTTTKTSIVTKNAVFSTGVVYLVGIIACVFIVFKYNFEINNVRNTIKSQVDIEATNAAKSISNQFNYLFNSLETISKLSGVQNMYASQKGLNESDQAVVQGLYSLISKEVIIGDNSLYSLSDSDNFHRAGLVFSMPLYGLDNKLAGIVSGVFLSQTLQELLQTSHNVIQNEALGFNLRGGDVHDAMGLSIPVQGQEFSEQYLEKNNLLYAKRYDLNMQDSRGGWILTSQYSMDEYWQDSKVETTQLFTFVVLLATLLLSWRMALLIRYYADQKNSVDKYNVELKKKFSLATQHCNLAKRNPVRYCQMLLMEY